MYRYKLTSNELKVNYIDNGVIVFEDSELSCYPNDFISSLDIGNPVIQIMNTDTNNIKSFYFESHDRMSDGEIAGTNYKSKDGIKLLIIND